MVATQQALDEFGYGVATVTGDMVKTLITSFLILIVAAPALAKSKDVYPVPCDALWAAVKDTLDNPRNYGIISMDDAGQRASFVVVGNLTQYTDRVALTSRDGGCAMKATFLEVGPDNADWLQFHRRFEKSLTKLQAAKPKPAAGAMGQQ
jgi:hypothetical protein